MYLKSVYMFFVNVIINGKNWVNSIKWSRIISIVSIIKLKQSEIIHRIGYLVKLKNGPLKSSASDDSFTAHSKIDLIMYRQSIKWCNFVNQKHISAVSRSMRSTDNNVIDIIIKIILIRLLITGWIDRRPDCSVLIIVIRVVKQEKIWNGGWIRTNNFRILDSVL